MFVHPREVSYVRCWKHFSMKFWSTTLVPRYRSFFRVTHSRIKIPCTVCTSCQRWPGRGMRNHPLHMGETWKKICRQNNLPKVGFDIIEMCVCVCIYIYTVYIYAYNYIKLYKQIHTHTFQSHCQVVWGPIISCHVWFQSFKITCQLAEMIFFKINNWWADIFSTSSTPGIQMQHKTPGIRGYVVKPMKRRLVV